MPNSPAPDKHRISYLEFRSTYAKLERIAAARGVGVSDLIRTAIAEYADANEGASLITMIINPENGRTRTVFVNRANR